MHNLKWIWTCKEECMHWVTCQHWGKCFSSCAEPGYGGSWDVMIKFLNKRNLPFNSLEQVLNKAWIWPVILLFLLYKVPSDQITKKNFSVSSVWLRQMTIGIRDLKNMASDSEIEKTSGRGTSGWGEGRPGRNFSPRNTVPPPTIAFCTVFKVTCWYYSC